jgi:hypothetical protein
MNEFEASISVIKVSSCGHACCIDCWVQATNSGRVRCFFNCTGTDLRNASREVFEFEDFIADEVILTLVDDELVTMKLTTSFMSSRGKIKIIFQVNGETLVGDLLTEARDEFNVPFTMAWQGKLFAEHRSKSISEFGLVNNDRIATTARIAGGGKRARGVKVTRADRIAEAQNALQLAQLQLNGMAQHPIVAAAIPLLNTFTGNEDALKDKILRLSGDEVLACLTAMNASNDEKARIAPLVKKVFDQVYASISTYNVAKGVVEDTCLKCVLLSMYKMFVDSEGMMKYKGDGGYEQMLLKVLQEGPLVDAPMPR